MNTNYNQLSYSLDSDEILFPYPSGELTDDDFTQRKLLKINEPNGLQIEFRLLSSIEFSVQSNKSNERFIEIFKHKNLKFHKNPKNKNLYELSLKHYIYVLSKIKVFDN